MDHEYAYLEQMITLPGNEQKAVEHQFVFSEGSFTELVEFDLVQSGSMYTSCQT